jgi:hypothetical protein
MEIVAGPGTAARFGDVCIWAGPGASEQLVLFLVESARNVSASPLGGARIADHIGGVLAGRDPEAGVPFACVGPGPAGTAVLLHGAVQAWDGSRWLVPQPRPGWLRTEVAGSAPVSVAAHGTVSPWVAPGSDLRRGVVPAAGFSLVPDPEAAIALVAPGDAEPTVVAATEPAHPHGRGPRDRTAVMASTTVAPEAAEAAGVPGAAGVLGAAEAARAAEIDRDRPAEAAEAARAAEIDRDRPAGVLDLAREGPSPLPPLPPVSQPLRPVPGQPVVAGVLCPVQHFNHPAVRTCVVCRRPVAAEAGRVSGSRPALGVLVVDDRTVYRLDHSYLIGSNPDSDPTVTGGRMRPLTLQPGPGGPGVAQPAPGVSASHAEIRVTGWDVSVIDRGSGGVTQVLAPGGPTWTPLRPFIAHSLAPGAHVAIGSRVLSLISPWPIDAPIT